MKLGVGVSPTTSIVAAQTAAVISAGGGGGGGPTIASILESRVFMWNAEVSTTSQTVANQESSPADSSSQTTYDAVRGTGTGSDSRDPNYDSGNKYYSQVSNSSADFVTMEGFKTATAFTHSCHKDGAQFTIEIGVHKPSSQGGYVISTAEDTDDTGVSLQTYNDGRIQFTCHRGTSGSFCFTKVSDAAIASGKNHLIISIDEGVTNGSFFYNNDATTDTFTATYSSPSTGNATYNWHWMCSLLNGSTSGPRFPMGQNDGVGYCAVYNKAVSAAEAAILYDNAPTRYQVQKMANLTEIKNAIRNSEATDASEMDSWTSSDTDRASDIEALLGALPSGYSMVSNEGSFDPITKDFMIIVEHDSSGRKMGLRVLQGY